MSAQHSFADSPQARPACGKADTTDERASPATFFGLFFSGLAGFASGRGLKG